MTISYRILQGGDAPSYREIRLESLKLHPESYGSTYEDEQKKAELFFESQIKNKHSNNLMIGAFSNSALVGLCGLIANESNQFLVVQMYVRDAYKRQGVGQALISEAKHLLLKYKRSSLVLAVYEYNTQA
ncbi:GNAT family N-acetyltransferase [Veronia nyctiphanis]|nr:GNAT family N-acetyltransferase [Veronia nyctiphanis]